MNRANHQPLRSPSGPTRRRGIASLEFVLVFPFLLALVAALFIVGRAGEYKFQTVWKSRYDAWRQRPQADPGQPLRLGDDPLTSAVGAVAQETYTPGSVLRGVTLPVESESVLIAGTWDHGAVPFAPGQPGFLPHLDVLHLAADNLGGAGAVTAGLPFFAAVMSLPANPALAAASQALNAAVGAAGRYLKYVIAPLVRVFRGVVEVLRRAAQLAFQRGLARRLGRVVGLLDVAVEAFDNLHEAAQGRPGRWDPGLARRLNESVP